MALTPYQQKLRLPQWQKRRLHLLERAEWRCAACGADNVELHVHHLAYDRGKEPWDYPDENFLILCRPCHETRIHEEGGLYRDVPDLRDYRVIRFEHIDDFRCFQPIRRYWDEEFLFEVPSEHFLELMSTELRQRLGRLFAEHGWEGDGDINCIFVPPCFSPNGYSICETLFHVKQQNNGTSFLALPPAFTLKLRDDMWA